MAVYAELRRLGKPIFTTQEAALRTGVSVSSATQILTRLRDADLAYRLLRGLWTLEWTIDPLILPEYLTVPFPAYISFQSALFFHGMIGQIPQVFFVASLGPTRRVNTSVGTYSIHRLAPRFFGGYRTAPESGIHLAVPEKALLDTLYLASARSRMFSSLPELRVGRSFDATEARRWMDRIASPLRRTMVYRRLLELLGRRVGRFSNTT